MRKQYLSCALVQLPQNSNYIVFLLWHKFITGTPIWFSLPISKLKKLCAINKCIFNFEIAVTLCNPSLLEELNLNPKAPTHVTCFYIHLLTLDGLQKYQIMYLPL